MAGKLMADCIRNISICWIAVFMLLFHVASAIDPPPPPSVGDDPPPIWLEITSTSPSSTSVSQQKGTTNTFSVTLNQQAASKWFLDGIAQPSTSLSYTKAWSAGDLGLHNITYFGSITGDIVSNTWMVSVLEFVDNAPTSSLVSPPSPYLANSVSVAFSCSATDDINLVNMTLYGSWSGWGAKKTNALAGTSGLTTFTETLSEGEYVWTCMAQDSFGNKGFAANNNTLIVNLTMPPTPQSHLTAAYARIVLWPNALTISPGSSDDSAGFQLTVNNTGGVSLDGLFFESGTSWIDVNSKKFALGVNELKVLSASISTSRIIPPGSYSVTILLKNADKTFDDISIPVIVLSVPDSANASTIDVKAIRQELERVKNRIILLSGQGYDTSVAKGYADIAEGLFNKTEYITAFDHIALADRELEKIENSVSNRKLVETLLKSYVFLGIIACVLVVLYLIYKKHMAKKEKLVLMDSGLNAVAGTNSVPSAPEKNAEIEDMVKRLGEIKKHVGK